jgi:hypothetical protein
MERGAGPSTRKAKSLEPVTPQDVLNSLMNDGTFDSLRHKIINQLKHNVSPPPSPLSQTLIRSAVSILSRTHARTQSSVPVPSVFHGLRSCQFVPFHPSSILVSSRRSCALSLASLYLFRPLSFLSGRFHPRNGTHQAFFSCDESVIERRIYNPRKIFSLSSSYHFPVGKLALLLIRPLGKVFRWNKIDS